jgi:uncharacterized coiled-coil protein SlyX
MEVKDTLMDIAQIKADLKVRQETLVKELNQVITEQQALAQRRAELTEEALRLNGEARMLNRLNGDKPEE